MDEKIIFKEESYKIIGICMNIHSTLGNGFLEAVYSEVLEKNLLKKYKADFICFDNIILEIKAVSFIHENFTKQTLNYLKATDKKLGLLINFGEKSLKYKRIINL